uniref:BZIP domain-containing protein n=1 Tax=Elaeophora elaphi TaxID=1147741 RepID=A0A0R3RK45_9BILA
MLNSPSNLHSSCGVSDFSSPSFGNNRGEEGEKVDSAEFERRELRRMRNNDAARRSREARRAKEAKNRIRMAALEQENGVLRAQIDVLKKELEHVHLVILATNVTWKRLLQNQF